MKYLLCLAYLGTDYVGFQVQPRGKTVQGELCAAGEKLFGAKCLVTGCSRTDSGVHAIEYYATLDTGDAAVNISPENLPRAINTYLPDDISVKSAECVADGFSIRKSVAGKEYMYLVHSSPCPDPFLRDRALEYPRPLDIEKMRRAAEHFVGYHDFGAFMASGSDIADTRRTVTELKIEEDGETMKIFVSADGFLYNMVRIIAGTLLEVSEGKIEPEEIPEIITSRDRASAGRTVPAKGLYLYRVFLK